MTRTDTPPPDAPARTSAVDVLAPPPAPDTTAEPADALSDLLAADPAVGLTPDEQADILMLDRLKRAKAQNEKAAKALARDIERVQTRLIELGIEHGLVDDRGRLALGAVDDGQGFLVNPYEMRTIWPKFRTDPDTDQPYQREHLLHALRAAGLDHLVVETTDQYGYPGYVRDRVKAWRQACGQAGIRDDQGRFCDLDGEPLDADEARDPLADIYALPRALRAVVEPVDRIELRFTRRPVAPADPSLAVDGAGDLPRD